MKPTQSEDIKVGDANPGERILILSGSCTGKIVTVLEKLSMARVRVDGKEFDNLICFANKAKRLKEETDNGDV